VDIGIKAEAMIPLREMQSLSTEDRAALRIGDVILVFVVQAEEKEGQAILSIDRARQEKSWRRLHHAHEHDEIIQARVVNYNKGGLLVDLDGIRGFVPSSQVSSITSGPDNQKQSDMSRLVGQDLTMKVIELNRSRNRLILSERRASQALREDKKQELLTALAAGDLCTCHFGVFVDIGGIDGLVHLSELAWGRDKHPEEIVRVGETVRVYVLSIDNDRKRISLSIKRTQHEPWATVGERYHPGQVVQGTITQLAAFGAFARIEEGIEGLIHISEFGSETIQHPRDVVAEGDTVQVRIIRIDATRKRMGLSLRLPAAATDQDDTDA
jgi:small subunit ribosomal protein S1